MQRRPNLTLTHELLQRHFACLYMELEPREITDEMFQAGHLTVFEHDKVTESNQRYKRLSCLLVILRKKNLYAQLVCTLQSLGYMSVLDTLQKDRKLKNKPCKYLYFVLLNLKHGTSRQIWPRGQNTWTSSLLISLFHYTFLL